MRKFQSHLFVQIPVELIKEGNVNLMTSTDDEDDDGGAGNGAGASAAIGSGCKPRWTKCKMLLIRAAGGCMLEFYVPPKVSRSHGAE